jgi:hypothetical protein
VFICGKSFYPDLGYSNIDSPPRDQPGRINWQRQELLIEIDERWIDRKSVDLRIERRIQIVIADYVQDMPSVTKIRPPGQALDLLSNRRCEIEGGVQQVDEQSFCDGRDICGQCIGGKRVKIRDIRRSANIDFIKRFPGWRLWRRLQVRSVVPFNDQKFLFVDREDLADSLSAIRCIQHVGVFPFFPREKIDSDDAGDFTLAIRRSRDERVILKQRVLHHPEQIPIVGADRQTR